MEVSAIADAVGLTTTHSIGFSNFTLPPHCCNSFNHFSILCGSSSEPSYTTGILSIMAGISAVIAPPAIRSNTYRTAPRAFTRQRRRTRRRTSTGDSDDGGEDGFFGDGDGDDGLFGGGRDGGSGGKRGRWAGERRGDGVWERGREGRVWGLVPTPAMGETREEPQISGGRETCNSR